jgi:hypothetical protein
MRDAGPRSWVQDHDTLPKFVLKRIHFIPLVVVIFGSLTLVFKRYPHVLHGVTYILCHDGSKVIDVYRVGSG